MPRKPRSEQIDPSRTCWFHLTSRVVQKLRRLDSKNDERKSLLLNYIKDLNSAFSLDIAAWAILGNHTHIVVRLNPDRHLEWSDSEVVERWAKIHPPRDTHYNPIQNEQRFQAWFDDRLKDKAWLEQTREKLGSVSQFMKDFKQFAAQTFNKFDKTVGHFWEGRFRSEPLDNREAVLAAMAYVDLNPFAAKLCEVPEEADFTSLKERVEARDLAVTDNIEASDDAVVKSSDEACDPNPERELWFSPIDDSVCNCNGDHGLFRGYRLDSYLKLVDAVARMFRKGKHQLDKEVDGILDRLKLCGETFQDRLARLVYRMNFVT